MQRLRAFDEKVFALLADALAWDKVKPRLLQLYAHSFTNENLDGILAFYHSPAG